MIKKKTVRRASGLSKRQPKPAFKQHPKAKAALKTAAKTKPAAKKAPAAKPVALDLKTQAGREARDSAIVQLFVAGMIPDEIAGKMRCDVRIVTAAVRAAKLTLSEQEIEVARAKHYQPGILADWRAGIDCETLGKRFKLKPREVRAAIYLAQQAGKAGGIYDAVKK